MDCEGLALGVVDGRFFRWCLFCADEARALTGPKGKADIGCLGDESGAVGAKPLEKDGIAELGFGLMGHVRFSNIGSGYASGWRSHSLGGFSCVLVFIPVGEYMGGSTTIERWVSDWALAQGVAIEPDGVLMSGDEEHGLGYADECSLEMFANGVVARIEGVALESSLPAGGSIGPESMETAGSV